MKRRANHEGSVYQLPNGLWRGCTRTPRGRKYASGHTQQEVLTKLRAIANQIDSGESIAPPTRQKLSAFIAQWLAYIKPRVRPNTYESYLDICELHITPSIGTIRLTALTPYDIESALTRAREKKLSARSIAAIRQVLSMALKKAVQWEKLKRNPAESIAAPKRVRSDIHPFDDDEFKAFRDAIKTHHYHALFLIAVTMGLRKGELLGLKWSDIDGDQLHVRRTLQPVGELAPKTESSKRTIRIPKATLAALDSWRIRQKEWRLKAGAQWNDQEYVFTTHIGTPLDRRNVTRWFAKILKDAKIAHHRFHDLRHTCATHLLRSGAKLADVSALLGHSSKAMTLDVYSHAIGSGAEVAAIMDSIVG